MALIKCPECGKDVSSSAASCPNCGHPISQAQPKETVVEKTTVVKEKKKGSCLSGILVFVVIIVIILVVASKDSDSSKSSSSSSSTATSTAESSASEEAVEEVQYLAVTSTELIDAYNDNQVKCKQDYDGKMLEVTGTVQSIGTDVMDNTYVCLGHDTDFTFVGIQCYTKDEDVINKIAGLKEGDVITVRGEGSCGSLSFSLNDIDIM